MILDSWLLLQTESCKINRNINITKLFHPSQKCFQGSELNYSRPREGYVHLKISAIFMKSTEWILNIPRTACQTCETSVWIPVLLGFLTWSPLGMNDIQCSATSLYLDSLCIDMPIRVPKACHKIRHPQSACSNYFIQEHAPENSSTNKVEAIILHATTISSSPQDLRLSTHLSFGSHHLRPYSWDYRWSFIEVRKRLREEERIKDHVH